MSKSVARCSNASSYIFFLKSLQPKCCNCFLMMQNQWLFSHTACPDKPIHKTAVSLVLTEAFRNSILPFSRPQAN